MNHCEDRKWGEIKEIFRLERKTRKNGSKKEKDADNKVVPWEVGPSVQTPGKKGTNSKSHRGKKRGEGNSLVKKEKKDGVNGKKRTLKKGHWRTKGTKKADWEKKRITKKTPKKL